MSVAGVFDLRERLHHADAVADRVWNQSWRAKGVPLATIRNGLEPFLKAESRIPFAMVVEIDDKVCGNALVIDNDEEARPELTPWLAALWVDEGMRNQGIAARLLEEGVRRCAVLGVPDLYLVSRPALQSFYAKLGWRIIEENVGKHGLTVYVREVAAR